MSHLCYQRNYFSDSVMTVRFEEVCDNRQQVCEDRALFSIKVDARKQVSSGGMTSITSGLFATISIVMDSLSTS